MHGYARCWAAAGPLAAMALAGCASHAGTDGTTTRASAAAVQHTSGMVMPDGSTMGAMPTQSSKPSAAALMVCSDDVRGHIAEALRLPSLPPGTGTWANSTYTCSYQLPMGPLVLSVTEAKDDAGTTAVFTRMRTTLGASHDLIGLGQGAYGTADGVVVLRKDHDVLKVDATRLPTVFGPEGSQRPDFAYEVASDVLGCWTGDD